MCLLFPSLCREAVGTAKMLYFPYSDEGSDRYMNYSLPLDCSSSFSKMKVFRVFFLSVSGSSLLPNKKRTLSCDRCAFRVVRNRLRAWFRMHTYGTENYIELRTVSQTVSSLWRQWKIRLIITTLQFLCRSLFRFYPSELYNFVQKKSLCQVCTNCGVTYLKYRY